MSDTPGSNYSRLDRLLHRWAFSGIEIQKSLADMEDRMHAKRMESIAIEKPVFITALPRAGTTLLLDFVARQPGFVTHTYRCMPFVLCPILWDSVSRGFRRPAAGKERAHGDGMIVSYDSPEAFEEILWKAFWPKKFTPDRIALWTQADRNPEFEQFFRNHIRKLIALGQSPNRAPNRAGGRYVSKNNANIARIRLLRRIFPDCVFVVPFRDPVDQAASLMRQHRHFTTIHASDAFARYYMETIGHFEFGAGLRRIDFPGAPEGGRAADPMHGDFWLSYWIRAYSHLLGMEDAGLRFMDFDRMCAEPLPALEALCRELGAVEAFGHIAEEAANFHPAMRYDAQELGLDPEILGRARNLQAELSKRAIN